MTTPTAPVATIRHAPGLRLLALIRTIMAQLARLALPARLGRLSDHQLKDAGLIRHDIDWLRSTGCSRDAADQLVVRAGLRAGNW